jgi:uncharacterized protein YdaU (DUF1376 family)
VNYYERHLGDYARDTGHLSLIEHGVYTLLLDAYYSREKPLPAEMKECCKLARAASKPERDAVAYVLREFFTESADGFRQARADAEIERFKEKQRKAAASANARWNKSDGNANASPDAMRTHSEGNALQSPVTSNQSKSAKRTPRKSVKSPIPEDFGLTAERSAYAERYLPSVDPEALMATFRSMAKAKAWEYADWDQHWQTLVRQWAPNSGHWTSEQYPRRPLNGGVHAGVVMR